MLGTSCGDVAMDAMSISKDTSERLLPMGALCRRYSVTDRTIDRWLERGILPEPLRINRYRYWRVSDLERFEREHLSASKAETAA
jgi:predicted DNA-binding transcriptional regulator AlpA